MARRFKWTLLLLVIAAVGITAYAARTGGVLTKQGSFVLIPLPDTWVFLSADLVTTSGPMSTTGKFYRDGTGSTCTEIPVPSGAVAITIRNPRQPATAPSCIALSLVCPPSQTFRRAPLIQSAGRMPALFSRLATWHPRKLEAPSVLEPRDGRSAAGSRALRMVVPFWQALTFAPASLRLPVLRVSSPRA